MWKHRILYLAVVISVLISYIIADRKEPLALLLLLLFVPFSAIVVQSLALRSLKMTCSVRRICRAGQTVPCYLELTRDRRLPMGKICLDLTVENLLFQEQQNWEFSFQTSEHREMKFCHSFLAKDCGTVQIHASQMRCYDQLGLFCWKRPVHIQEELTIYPPEIQLHVRLTRRPEAKSQGEIYDPYRKGQDVSEVSGLREYLSGDSLNSVHWKMSGKLDRLIVREFGHPSDYHTIILYDVMKKNGEKMISNTCNNAVLALTAALSYNMMQMNLEHNVGRMYLGQIRTIPVNSVGTYEEMMAHLLSVPVLEEGSTENAMYLFLQGNYVNQYTKVIYITPFYDETAARRMAREVDLTLLHVSEGRELDYISSAGYTLIPVDANTYQEMVHNLDI